MELRLIPITNMWFQKEDFAKLFITLLNVILLFCLFVLVHLLSENLHISGLAQKQQSLYKGT